MISEHFLEELKYATDIEQLISSYVALKHRGRTAVGLCPFHSEKTPSFTVYPETQSYYCFGCAAGGDAVTFLRQIENLEYIEAVRMLAERAGMTMPADTPDDGAARQKTRILEINRESARFFHACLVAESGKTALEYLLARGLAHKTIKQFGLGYAPPGWDSLLRHLRAKGFREEDLFAAQVTRRRNTGGYYDLFRDRLIFPIMDLRGNVIGFGGRVVQGSGPKYLNSPDTPVFKKSRNLFALNLAKNSGSDTLILGEGYMDVIAMHQAGFQNAVATLGTALTGEQARLLARYTQNVVLAYDSDEAGQKAAKRAITLFGQTDLAVRVLEIEGAKDPDEYIQKFGAARFQNLLEGGKSAMRFEIDKLKSRHDLQNPDGKVAFLGEFCRMIAQVYNPLQRDVYIGEIARELDVRKEQLLSTVDGLIKQRNYTARKKQSHNLAIGVQDNSGAQTAARSRREQPGEAAEKNLLMLLLQHPDAISKSAHGLDSSDFTNGSYAQIYNVLKEQASAEKPVELFHLSSRLPPEQMAVASKLLVEGKGLNFRAEQAGEYIQAIEKNRNRKSDKEVAAMSAEEYQAYITSLRANKK